MERRSARHAAGQRHRRHHGATAPQDRRSVREEARPHGPRSGIRPGSETAMKSGALSVRARLALWHAGVLTLIVCVFSGGLLLFVKTSLFGGLDHQVRRALMTIDWVYHHEPHEIGDLASESGIALFQVVVRGKVHYQTEGWERAGLAGALRDPGTMPPTSWTAPDGRWYRVQALAEPSYSIATAIEEDSLRDTMRTLAAILAIGVPLAVCLAIAGGYFLAGRVLSPVGAMAEKAREITADSLDERLPVGNPQDEFGRLATVFNDTLSRLHDAFDRLRRFTADASHELRTPLTAIRSVGEIALQAPLDARKYRDVIGSMLEQGDRRRAALDRGTGHGPGDSQRPSRADLRALLPGGPRSRQRIGRRGPRPGHRSLGGRFEQRPHRARKRGIQGKPFPDRPARDIMALPRPTPEKQAT